MANEFPTSSTQPSTAATGAAGSPARSDTGVRVNVDSGIAPGGAARSPGTLGGGGGSAAGTGLGAGGMGASGSSSGMGGSALGGGTAGAGTGSTTAANLGAGSSAAGTMGGPNGGSAERTLDKAVKATHQAVDRAAGTVEMAAGRMRSGVQHLTEMEREWADTARSRVREHPLAAVGAALAIGMMIGRLTAGHHRQP